MMGVHVYQAPKGQPLDGLIDPVDLPRTVRLIARPNQKTMHPMLVDILKSLGVTRGVPTKGYGAASPLNLAAAWSLAHGVTAVYIGEAQDLSAEAIAECIDFGDRIGASLHLVFGFGLVHTHSTLLKRRGAAFMEFEDLPHLIRHPVHIVGGHEQSETKEQRHIPDDDWPTFRAAYRDMWSEDESATCDAIYTDTIRAVQVAGPASPDELAAVIGEQWHRHLCEGHRRLVATRAAQAAMFLAGWNVKVKERWLERYVVDRHLNPLQSHHHRALSTVAEPWRSSSAILHAHHVRVPDMLALKARDVSLSGEVAGLELTETERLIVRAQRWTQLVSSQEPDPMLIERQELAVRNAIRKLTKDLELPLLTEWRRSDDKKFDIRVGVTMDALAVAT